MLPTDSRWQRIPTFIWFFGLDLPVFSDSYGLSLLPTFPLNHFFSTLSHDHPHSLVYMEGSRLQISYSVELIRVNRFTL